MTFASIRVTTVFEIETRDLRTTLYKKASLMLQPVAKIIDTLYHILALLEEKLWLERRREVSIKSHKCVSSSDLKYKKGLFSSEGLSIFATG